MASIITNKLRRAISEAIYDDIFSRRNNYYWFFNKVDSGYSLETTPLNTLEYETFVRNNMVAAKRIYSSDVSFVVPRFNWVSGTTYTQYNILLSGQSTLASGPRFYVYDDVNFRVYKCLSNNENSPSTVKPGSIALTATSAEPITYADGYTWKYMYSIPKTLRNKFLTADYIPVLTALQKRYYSDGGIGELTIIKAGQDYVQGTTTITVTGDGTGAVLEPVIVNGKLGNVIVKNPGRDYTRAVITIASSGIGTGAEVIAEVNKGDLDSDQALVELLTTPGTVDTIEVISGGSGYITASVKIEGDGTGAQAQAIITGSSISAIIITNKGSGYSWAKAVITAQVSPAITTAATTRANVSPFLGHGRNAIEELFSNTLMFYGNISSDRLSDFDVVSAYKQYGLIKNIRNLEYSSNIYDQVAESRYQVEADFGPKITFFGGSGSGARGTVNVTGKFVSGIEIEDPGTGFSSTPTVNITGSGTTSIDLILLGGSTMVKTVSPATTANLIIGAKLTAVGGYISADTYITSITDYRTFTISKPAIASSQAAYTIETTASATATISASVNSVALGYKGVGYASQPAVIFGSSTGYGATATSTIDSGVGAITITNQGTGYTSAPTITFDNTGTNGTGAAATAYVAGGKIIKIEVTDPGSGYTSAPTISFGGPGSSAAATASLTYVVSELTLAAGGSKYETTPTVEFSGSSGISKIEILDPGTSFTSAPTVTITGGGGSGAAGTAYIEDVVRSISIVNGGSGYVTAPTVSISGPGGSTGATGTAVISGGKVVQVIITNRGSGYTSASVTFSAPPAGVTATGTVSVGRGIVAINVTAPGVGYTSSPVVSISGGGGSSYAVSAVLGKATATATISGSLKSITLTNSGNNYTATPTVTITGGGGIGASAYAKVVGYVSSITIDNGGTGYNTAPTVMITGGEGIGAVGVATVSGGVVQTVNLTNNGNGYVTTKFSDFPIGTILVDTNLNEFEVHSAKTNRVMNSLLLTTKDGVAVSGVATLRKKLSADYFITKTAISSNYVESRFPVACYKVRGDFNLVDYPAGTVLTLTDQTNGDKKFTVISGRDIVTEKELLILPTNGGTINNGVTLSNGIQSFSVSTYNNPEIDRRTGDILMISNSNSTFTQNSDQTLSFRTIVNF